MRRLWNSEAVSFAADVGGGGGFMFTYAAAVFSVLVLVSFAIFVCAEGVKEPKMTATEPRIYDGGGAGCAAACAACGA